jgi:hypothetical protein
MVRDTITVKGRAIEYEIKDVDIFNLEYYKDNPRINHIISKYPPEKVTQEFIEEKLLDLDSTKELIKDLEENKGLLDEVYVLGNKVVEGNRRLCAYRRLYKRERNNAWRYIKTRILCDSLTEEELFFILGTFHIKGKQPWDAYEKASYIYRMIQTLKKSPREIGRQLGHNKKTIEAMMKSYEVMTQKYLSNSSDEELIGETRDDLKKYSYFEAFFRQGHLSKRYEETPEFMDDFIDWVRSGRLPKAQDVRELPKILNNKKATRYFYDEEPENAFKRAMALLYTDKPEKVDPFYKKVREFRELIQNTSPIKTKNEIKASKSRKYELQKCYRDFKRFCKHVGLDVR